MESVFKILINILTIFIKNVEFKTRQIRWNVNFRQERKVYLTYKRQSIIYADSFSFQRVIFFPAYFFPKQLIKHTWKGIMENRLSVK